MFKFINLKWVDQMFKLNDQKTKLTLQSDDDFRQDEISK